VASLATVVAVDIVGFAAMHGNVTSLSTPVTFHFITDFLDVAEPAAGVALLLVGMVAVTGHMAGLATGVACLIPLLLRLLAVPRDVACPVAVVARVFTLFTVSGHVALLSTTVADLVLPTSTSPATATPSIRAVLEPVPRPATSKAVATVVHVHYLSVSDLATVI